MFIIEMLFGFKKMEGYLFILDPYLHQTVIYVYHHARGFHEWSAQDERSIIILFHINNNKINREEEFINFD